MKKKLILAATLAALSSAALADTTAAAKVSTLGYGLDVAFPMTESIDARIGFNTFSYNTNKNSNGTNYSGQLSLGTLAALADWHPWEGSFRLTGGLMYNNNKFSMTAQPTGATVMVGGKPYAAAGTSVNANVTFGTIAPYLGLGWGSAPKDTGFSFAADFGIMFQGKPKGAVTATGPGANQAGLQNSLIQANADLNASLKNFQYYPVASVGIGYTF